MLRVAVDPEYAESDVERTRARLARAADPDLIDFACFDPRLSDATRVEAFRLVVAHDQ